MLEKLRAPMRPMLLIVDDQPSNIAVLYAIFKEECEVCIATSGVDALAFCRKRSPDLILLDIVMPGMEGFAVCRALKDDPALSDIPIIFVTAEQDPEQEARALDAGAADFITKPFHSKVVLARVRAHLLIKRQSDALRHLALADGLTGIANRRHFDTILGSEWRRCVRSRSALAIVLIDVDFFKRYNDLYGHQQGDLCLIEIATVLKTYCVRSHDLVARYGGEEFVCILPDTHGAGACHVARQIETAVRGLKLVHAQSDAAQVVTVSIGVAVAEPAMADGAAAALIAADRELYAAKAAGRGRVSGIVLLPNQSEECLSQVGGTTSKGASH